MEKKIKEIQWNNRFMVRRKDKMMVYEYSGRQVDKYLIRIMHYCVSEEN